MKKDNITCETCDRFDASENCAACAPENVHCGCITEGGERKTVRDKKEKHYLEGRINRVIGQLGGIKRMIEEDRYCEDVLVQLSALTNALKSISSYMLEQHMRGCVVRDIKAGNESSVDEVLELFKRFMR